MNRSRTFSVLLVAVTLLSASVGVAASAYEQPEAALTDVLPRAAMPKGVSKAVADAPLAPSNGDTLCEDIDIIFVMDCSGSMSITDAQVNGSPATRLAAAQAAAKDFIDLLPTGTSTRVGV
ncbi:MAG: hypothetical protein ACP5JJ_17435, partial [Anaerolineae bacterium]